jgi:hypothetical protein
VLARPEARAPALLTSWWRGRIALQWERIGRVPRTRARHRTR